MFAVDRVDGRFVLVDAVVVFGEVVAVVVELREFILMHILLRFEAQAVFRQGPAAAQRRDDAGDQPEQLGGGPAVELFRRLVLLSGLALDLLDFIRPDSVLGGEGSELVFDRVNRFGLGRGEFSVGHLGLGGCGLLDLTVDEIGQGAGHGGGQTHPGDAFGGDSGQPGGKLFVFLVR